MGWRDDPLMVCRPLVRCEQHQYPPHKCRPRCTICREVRADCTVCKGTGWPLTDAAKGLWINRAAFMVCGGPSLAALPLDRLRERGVASLAINNAGAFAPVKAHTFGDPQTKFHSDMFSDPNVMSFVPFGKLNKPIQIKHEGEFYPTNILVKDCPNVWGFSRGSEYDYKTFLTDPSAQWGRKGQPLETQTGKHSKLCTMLLGMRLLHYLGVRRIYFIGVDFSIPPRGTAPGYAWGDDASAGNRIFTDKIDPMMAELKPVFEAAGVDIFNCNPVSNCRTFEYVPFDEAIRDCKGPVADEPLDCTQWYDKDLAKRHHAKHPRLLTLEDVAALRGYGA